MEDDRERLEAIEQRVRRLEERNERLEDELRERAERDITRRQAIAGLLGGAAFGAGAGSLADDWVADGLTGSARPDASGTVDAAAVEAARLNGIRQPWPGDVQSAIDDVSKAGGGVVRLVPTETYDPASTWHVKPGVTLDYGGAQATLTTDIDLAYVYPGAQVRNAWNDLTGLGEYTSAVYTYDTNLAGDYDLDAGRTGVCDGQTYGPSLTAGRLFRLIGDPNTEIVFTYSSQRASGFDTIVEIDSGEGTGEKGWVNGNVIDGIYSGFRRGIWTHGSNDVLSNLIGGQWQTANGCEYIWQHDHGDRNVFSGIAWDTIHCEKASWEVNSGEDNLFATLSVLFNVENNSGESNLVYRVMSPFSVLSTIGEDRYYTAPPDTDSGAFATSYYEDGVGDHRHEEVFPRRTDRLLPLRMSGAGLGWVPADLTGVVGPAYPVVRYHDGTGGRTAGLYVWDPPSDRWLRVQLDASTTI